ncbi:molybdenum ABC transporter ATP-binding protein [Methylocella sp.]|uniref:molybdenum ABC transporter ATP-binding protein n=1 Tax=Methylocella sp. TaxID=1978226 RepID=UPI003784132D
MLDVDVKLDFGAFRLDVAFDEGAGITALFGPSGCGKSLTLSMIAGLMKPQQGFIRLDGEPLVDVEKGIFVPPHRRRIGVVFQEANLFPHLSVRRNLLFGRWFAPRREREIDFDAVVETLGLGKLLQRRPGRLSGGERQRVGIGRALLSCPRLLLFDEPLAALDMARKLEIMPLIERIRDDFRIPMVYVSHAVEEVVRLADRVVVLQAGRVRSIGEPNAVFGGGTQALDDRFEQSSALDVVVSDVDEAYGLVALKHSSGVIWTTAAAGPPGRRLRVVVRANDVVLSNAELVGVSPRNMLTGSVKAIDVKGPLALASVALDGGEELAALVTRKAVDELGLKPGARVFALLKTTALDDRLTAG